MSKSANLLHLRGKVETFADFLFESALMHGKHDLNFCHQNIDSIRHFLYEACIAFYRLIYKKVVNIGVPGMTPSL